MTKLFLTTLMLLVSTTLARFNRDLSNIAELDFGQIMSGLGSEHNTLVHEVGDTNGFMKDLFNFEDSGKQSAGAARSTGNGFHQSSTHTIGQINSSGGNRARFGNLDGQDHLFNKIFSNLDNVGFAKGRGSTSASEFNKIDANDFSGLHGAKTRSTDGHSGKVYDDNIAFSFDNTIDRTSREKGGFENNSRKDKAKLVTVADKDAKKKLKNDGQLVAAGKLTSVVDKTDVDHTKTQAIKKSGHSVEGKSQSKVDNGGVTEENVNLVYDNKLSGHLNEVNGKKVDINKKKNFTRRDGTINNNSDGTRNTNAEHKLVNTDGLHDLGHSSIKKESFNGEEHAEANIPVPKITPKDVSVPVETGHVHLPRTSEQTHDAYPGLNPDTSPSRQTEPVQNTETQNLKPESRLQPEDTAGHIDQPTVNIPGVKSDETPKPKTPLPAYRSPHLPSAPTDDYLKPHTETRPPPPEQYNAISHVTKLPEAPSHGGFQRHTDKTYNSGQTEHDAGFKPFNSDRHSLGFDNGDAQNILNEKSNQFERNEHQDIQNVQSSGHSTNNVQLTRGDDVNESLLGLRDYSDRGLLNGIHNSKQNGFNTEKTLLSNRHGGASSQTGDVGAKHNENHSVMNKQDVIHDKDVLLKNKEDSDSKFRKRRNFYHDKSDNGNNFENLNFNRNNDENQFHGDRNGQNEHLTNFNRDQNIAVHDNTFRNTNFNDGRQTANSYFNGNADGISQGLANKQEGEFSQTKQGILGNINSISHSQNDHQLNDLHGRKSDRHNNARTQINNQLDDIFSENDINSHPLLRSSQTEGHPVFRASFGSSPSSKNKLDHSNFPPNGIEMGIHPGVKPKQINPSHLTTHERGFSGTDKRDNLFGNLGNLFPGLHRDSNHFNKHRSFGFPTNSFH